MLGKIGAISGDEASARGWPEVTSSIQLDEYLAQGYILRALLLTDFEWNWPAAEADYRKALDLDPNNVAAHHWYARHLAEVGRSDEALGEIDAAQKLDPLSPVIRVTKAKILFVARRYDEAVEECQAALDLEPTFAPAFSMLGQAFAHSGRFAAAIEAAKRYVELSGGTGWAKLELAYTYAIAGKKAESDRLVNEATTGRTDFSPYDMATIHSAQHDAAGAMQWLQKAIEQRSVDVVWIRVDPRLDGARADPAFQRVVAQMVPRR